MHYLTVQDILWVNLQLTKRVNPFNYALLEDGVFYQYGYGESDDLRSQAARFLTGFSKVRPFETGNEATAFVGCFALLRMNGFAENLGDSDAVRWLSGIGASQAKAFEALNLIVADDPDYHPSLSPDVRTAVRGVMSDYPATLAALALTPSAV